MICATGTLVVGLYLWDSVCLQTVYSVRDNRWSYGRSLQLRGLSYLGGCVNYELGQGAFAWGLARLQNARVVRMLSRSVLLAYHDIFVLLTGTLPRVAADERPASNSNSPLARDCNCRCGGDCGAVPHPAALDSPTLSAPDGESYFEGWSFARSLRLVPMRFVYFGILLVYAVVALHICDISSIVALRCPRCRWCFWRTGCRALPVWARARHRCKSSWIPAESEHRYCSR